MRLFCTASDGKLGSGLGTRLVHVGFEISWLKKVFLDVV